MTSDNEDADLARAVELVFKNLGDDGSEEFERICLDNGLLWECETCGENCPVDAAVCPACGAGPPD